MIIGIVFMIAGLLIALYPPLLSLIVAGGLIFIGMILLLMSYHYKKLLKSSENPFIDFFIRF